MPRKKPSMVRERTATIEALTADESAHLKPWRRFQAHSWSGGFAYGMTVWGGTMEIVSLHTTGSIRQGPNAPPKAGTVIRVVPVVTSAGTCVFSPFASVSSAAREQLPSVMVHQFLVIG